jgi:hypothetical protein
VEGVNSGKQGQTQGTRFLVGGALKARLNFDYHSLSALLLLHDSSGFPESRLRRSDHQSLITDY